MLQWSPVMIWADVQVNRCELFLTSTQNVSLSDDPWWFSHMYLNHNMPHSGRVVVAVQGFWSKVFCNLRHKRNVCITEGINLWHAGGGPVLFFTMLSWLMVIRSTWGKWMKWIPLGVCVWNAGGDNDGEWGVHHLSMCTNVCPRDPHTL